MGELVEVKTKYGKIDSVESLAVVFNRMISTFEGISNNIDPLSERMSELAGTDRIDDLKQLLTELEELSKLNEECLDMCKLITMDEKLLAEYAARLNIPFPLNVMEEYIRSINLSRFLFDGIKSNIRDIITDIERG